MMWGGITHGQILNGLQSLEYLYYFFYEIQ